MSQPTPPAQPKPGVTVVTHLYRRNPREPDGPAASRAFTVDGLSGEQTFRRTLTVGPEWIHLPLGWTPDDPCLILCLDNDGPAVPRTVQPTPEEAEAERRLVVEVGTFDCKLFSLLPPSARLLIYPPPDVSYRVRCPSGRARLALFCVPA